MPIDDNLIPDPILDARTTRERIAARIRRSIGSLTVDDAQETIEYGEALKSALEELGVVPVGLLPEFSSARAPEAHIVWLTEIEHAFTQTLYRFNQLPNKVRIGLLRLLGVELQPATAATAALQFTKTGDYLNIEVTILKGTQVATEDRKVIVSTDADLIIPSGQASGTVAATASEAGNIGRLPINTLVLTLQAIAGLAAVSNITTLTGGANAETVEQGKIRAREEIGIGEHLGSTISWENWIYYEVLRRNGRVTAFEDYLSNFTQASLGYVLLVIQGADGLAPAQAIMDAVGAVIARRRIAGIAVSARAPQFKSFDLVISVTIGAGLNAATLTAKATSNLNAFFNPLRFPFGPNEPPRYIGLSDIVGQVEAASPRGISVATSLNRFAVSITIDDVPYREDILLTTGELPVLGNVAFNIV